MFAERLTKIVRVAAHCRKLAAKEQENRARERARVATLGRTSSGASFSAHAYHSALMEPREAAEAAPSADGDDDDELDEPFALDSGDSEAEEDVGDSPV